MQKTPRSRDAESRERQRRRRFMNASSPHVVIIKRRRRKGEQSPATPSSTPSDAPPSHETLSLDAAQEVGVDKVSSPPIIHSSAGVKERAPNRELMNDLDQVAVEEGAASSPIGICENELQTALRTIRRHENDAMNIAAARTRTVKLLNDGHLQKVRLLEDMNMNEKERRQETERKSSERALEMERRAVAHAREVSHLRESMVKKTEDCEEVERKCLENENLIATLNKSLLVLSETSASSQATSIAALCEKHAIERRSFEASLLNETRKGELVASTLVEESAKQAAAVRLLQKELDAVRLELDQNKKSAADGEEALRSKAESAMKDEIDLVKKEHESELEKLWDVHQLELKTLRDNAEVENAGHAQAKANHESQIATLQGEVLRADRMLAESTVESANRLDAHNAEVSSLKALLHTSEQEFASTAAEARALEERVAGLGSTNASLSRQYSDLEQAHARASRQPP